MPTKPINEPVHEVTAIQPNRSILVQLNSWIASREILLAVVSVGLFFLLNLSIASRSPFGGWMDEVTYVDPGLNAAAGKGWTSTVWPWQTDREFWAQNSPLYPGALFLWVKAFGISMVSTRAWCYLLGALGTCLLWLAAFRLKLLNPALRLFWIALLSMEYSTNWMMRNQRYDVWIFVGLGFALVGTSLKHPAGRYGLIFLGCCLGPLAGFISVPYLVSMAALLTVVAGFSRWKEALTAMVGTGCGMFAVFAIYALNHQLETFLHTLKSLSAASAKPSFTDKLQIFLYPRQDYGLMLIIAALLLLTLAWGKNLVASYHRWLLLGWGTVVLLPCIMLARAQFPMMYFYMAVIPLSLSVLALLAIHAARHRRQWLIPAMVVALLGAACLTGLPGRMFTSVKEWDFRDPGRMEAFVHAYISPDDRVLTDYKFYFELRDRVRQCVGPFYINCVPADEAAQINVALLDTAEFPDLTRDASRLKSIGGGWKKVAVFPTEEMQAKYPGRSPTYILYRR